MPERWIIVGTLKADALLFGRGLRGPGWWLNWRGRTDWCQPFEFVEMAHVESAVRTRLTMARLELVALASIPPRKEYQELWALVSLRTATRK